MAKDAWEWSGMNVEQLNKAETPEQMRAEIFRLRFHDSLVKTVSDLAEYKGLSAEDKYTILAYHALLERNRFMKIVLNWADIYPGPEIILKAEEAKP